MRTLLLVLAVMGVAVVGFSLLGGADDEKAIQRQLTKLALALSHTADDTDSLVSSVASAGRVLKFFTDDAEVDAGPPVGHVSGRAQFKKGVLLVRRLCDELSVSLTRSEFEFEPGGTEARVAVVLQGNARAEGQTHRESRTYLLTMVKQGGTWLIRKVERDVVFRRPDEA